ncbi:protein kinase domain protein [Aphelenchoides avenae]|nr:protein kinase domain protein [Aphelenchus avenae]
METKIAADTLDHEYDEVAESSCEEVPPDASLARIVSGSKAVQQAPCANNQQLDATHPSGAVFSADVKNRIFENIRPWDLKYRKGSQIGQGAFGKVFEAWLREDEDDLYKVAVKHVETRAEDFDRHMQEARLMLRFRHPYLLGCYEVYTCSDGCIYNVFVVMDCMSYGSLDVILAEMLENRAFFSEQSARYILYCCTQALAFLHAKSIIHRDVKSANILVSNEGRAKLGDFGLSGNLDEGAGTSIVGTPRYMAPEIARKFVANNSEAYTKEVDVFSLGVVGIELPCGQLPHRVGTPKDRAVLWAWVARQVRVQGNAEGLLQGQVRLF